MLTITVNPSSDSPTNHPNSPVFASRSGCGGGGAVVDGTPVGGTNVVVVSRGRLVVEGGATVVVVVSSGAADVVVDDSSSASVVVVGPGRSPVVVVVSSSGSVVVVVVVSSSGSVVVDVVVVVVVDEGTIWAPAPAACSHMVRTTATAPTATTTALRARCVRKIPSGSICRFVNNGTEGGATGSSPHPPVPIR